MNILAFCSATVMGAGIWVLVLAAIGYWFGSSQQVVLQKLHWITVVLVIGCVFLAVAYWRHWKTRPSRAQRWAH